MPAETCVMGLFKDDGTAARAILDLEGSGFAFRRAHSPVPSHKILEALKLKKGRVGWFTLAGGILGFFSGFALAIFTSTRWDLIVSGKLGVIKGFGTAEQVTLNTLAAGDFAGEMSWLDGSRRYASLVAMDATRVLGLEREKLEALLATDPHLVYRVMRAIVRAVHQIQRQLFMQQSELTNYIYKQHGRY